ncbi:MAG: ABC transporter transmembrane domain-containing protein, partial [Bacteroidota bacterium]
MVNLVVFGAVLIYYNWGIFLIFALGSLLFFGWIRYFMKRRAEIDFLRFNQSAANSEKTLELINGMQEIKLSTNEVRKRWEWEYLQAKLFEINLKGLTLDNWQNGGASLINQLKNILTTFYAATLVLNGQLSLGMMLSIAYIIGQMNVPLAQLLEFMQSYQDASLSMDRINDVYSQEEEQNPERSLPLPDTHSIKIRDLYFRYQGTRKDNFVIRGLDLHIP